MTSAKDVEVPNFDRSSEWENVSALLSSHHGMQLTSAIN